MSLVYLFYIYTMIVGCFSLFVGRCAELLSSRLTRFPFLNGRVSYVIPIKESQKFSFAFNDYFQE